MVSIASCCSPLESKSQSATSLSGTLHKYQLKKGVLSEPALSPPHRSLVSLECDPLSLSSPRGHLLGLEPRSTSLLLIETRKGESRRFLGWSGVLHIPAGRHDSSSEALSIRPAQPTQKFQKSQSKWMSIDKQSWWGILTATLFFCFCFVVFFGLSGLDWFHRWPPLMDQRNSFALCWENLHKDIKLSNYFFPR